MKIITINLSEPHIRALAMLQELGLYTSRSEAIRVALRDFLQKELGLKKKFDDLEEKIEKKEIQHEKRETIQDKKEEIQRLLNSLRKDRK